MKNDNLPQDEALRESTSPVGEVQSSTMDTSSASADKTNEEILANVFSETTDETITEENPKKNPKDTRKLRYGGIATALTAVVVSVVVLVNVVAGILADRYPLNIDLTKDKLFTLTADSTAIAKAIDEEVQLIVFAEETVFSTPNMGDDSLNTVLKQFYEATKQYNNLSGGKVTTSYVDLNSDPTQTTKYSKYEPQAGDILFISGTRSQKIAYSDLFSYDYDQYTGSTSNFASEVEKVMASRMTMVTSDVTPIVTMLTGHEEDANTMSGIDSILSVNNYVIEKLDITGSDKFNEESTVAVISAPAKDYNPEEIEKLRTWLDNDGKYNRQLMVIVNYAASCPNLYEFLNVEYGIEVTDNLVVETSNSRVYNYNSFSIYGDIATSDYTQALTGKKLLMPACRQLLTNKENNTSSALFNVDVATFPESAKQVAMAEALDQTADANTELTKIDAAEYPMIGAAYATKWGIEGNTNTRYATNVLVFGSQQMFMSQILSLTTVYNEEMILALTNGFTGNENTVSISNKPLEQTKLEFNSAQANIFFAVFIIILPIAVLIVCLVVFIRRRRL